MAQTMPEAPARRMTYEEFLEWADEDTYAEWVNGEVQFMSPVSQEHSDLGMFLKPLMRTLVEERDLGAIYDDPFQMKPGQDLPGRSPDILFVSKRNLGRLRKNYLDGPADLVVEIISPGSRRTDRVDKFHEYEKAGIPEYWIFDPDRRTSEFYRLRNGVYEPVLIDEDGIFRSEALPGFWIKVEWLWEGTRPRLLDVLKEWGLI